MSAVVEDVVEEGGWVGIDLYNSGGEVDAWLGAITSALPLLAPH